MTERETMPQRRSRGKQMASGCKLSLRTFFFFCGQVIGAAIVCISNSLPSDPSLKEKLEKKKKEVLMEDLSRMIDCPFSFVTKKLIK